MRGKEAGLKQEPMVLVYERAMFGKPGSSANCACEQPHPGTITPGHVHGLLQMLVVTSKMVATSGWL